MSLAFAAKAMTNPTFVNMAILSYTRVARDKVLAEKSTPGSVPLLELEFAKNVLRHPTHITEQATALILQVDAMHATDPAVTMPSDSTFLSAAQSTWSYMLAFNT